MKILLTGGAGYVGYSLVRALHRRPEISQIKVYDNLSRTGFNFFTGTEKLPKVQFIKGDILDTDRLKGALEETDVVYHLAAFVSQPYNHLQNLQYEQVNRWGTLSLTRAIEKCGSVSRVFYLSSTAVYGFRNDIRISDLPTPNNAYGDSKLEGEQYFKLLSEEKEIAVIRAANVFGYNPCMRLDSVINSWIFKGLTEGKINIYGSGDQERAFVSLESLTDQLCGLLDRKVESPTAVIDFCTSLNRIRDWLLTQLPELEYTYLNRNQLFPGQRFPEFDMDEQHGEILDRTFSQMRKSLVI